MVELVLMRHSKAVPSSPTGDHVRALSPRGRLDAAEAARVLADHLMPDYALVSDALRTRQTFECVQDAWGTAVPHRLEPELYGASTAAILEVIGTAPAGVERLLVVGHNPGIGEVARKLARRGDAAARADLEAHFPTSAFAILRIDRAWGDVAKGGALQAYVVPRGEDPS